MPRHAGHLAVRRAGPARHRDREIARAFGVPLDDVFHYPGTEAEETVWPARGPAPER